MPPALRTKRPALDTACADAVESARDAAAAAAPGADSVGEHLGVVAEGDRVASHLFACADHAYRGWHWSVIVARAARARAITVSEVTLLPGSEAIVAPEWVPWQERVQPGDLGPGDLLPTAPGDSRLQPGHAETGEDADEATWWEPGLGRERVLSADGRADTAKRWYTGEHGPDTPIAREAPGTCATCGFFVPLGGSLRQLFGVCANELVPADGCVVSLDHGCGGHSEATAGQEPPPVEVVPAVAEETFDLVELEAAPHHGAGATETAAVEELADADEQLGHS